jgi:hypothetical protein
MKEKRNIHNLGTLDGEIYRLKLAAKNIEERLDKNLDYLQENYWTMTMNSFFCKDKSKRNGEHSVWENFLKNDDFNTTINKIGGNIADKASEGLHKWMNNFFGKRNHFSR